MKKSLGAPECEAIRVDRGPRATAGTKKKIERKEVERTE
jgi:hypothetical protein